MTLNRGIAFFLLLMGGAWAAIINGQPFFMADTTAYVRGADFAVVYLLGPKFATAWTQEGTLNDLKSSPKESDKNALSTARVPLNAPFHKAIMAGRSFYYGALLYFAHITSHFWLAIFLQSMLFVFLSYVIVVRCLRLSFVSFGCVTSTVIFLSPVSFFISFLMPDVFASFLIFGLAILAAYWKRLRKLDRWALCIVIVYSSLTHTSHLLLLAGLGTISVIIYFLAQRRNANSEVGTRGYLMTLVALVLVALFGQLAFSAATRLLIGAAPVEPPFLMARLIADGPGYDFLRRDCGSSFFVVCRYLDRLPTSSDTFLWSTDPGKGVYNVADRFTRDALSSEQLRFVADVMYFDPAGVMSAAVHNMVRQLFAIGLDDLFLSPQRLDGFRDKVPPSYFIGMLHSRIATRPYVLTLLGNYYFWTYLFSIAALMLSCLSWPRMGISISWDSLIYRAWPQFFTLAISGTLMNAAICGILSEPDSRYQTRVSWIPLSVLCLTIALLLANSSATQRKVRILRRFSGHLPRTARFLCVGAVGLATDLGLFTVLTNVGLHALVARLGSLAIATMVTWRLNRLMTFDPSHRPQHDEAIRYATVTAVAQGGSYAVFAVLLFTPMREIPQAAIAAGAIVGAILSYNGHRLLSFSRSRLAFIRREEGM